MACGTVDAELDYLRRLPLYQQEKPFQLFVPIHERDQDARSTNLEFEKRTQTFVDIRDQVNDFSLDSHGFQVETSPSRLNAQSFGDQSLIKNEYLPEVENLLKLVGNSNDRVFIFDWRLRDAGAPREREDNELDMNDLATWLRPSPTVHVDQSASGVLHRVLLHLPDDAPFLLQGRVRLINVWRPIGNSVQDYPLACCDSTSVLDEDLIECDHVRRKFKGSNLYAHHRDGQRWYYLGEQRPEEVLLIKMFDSDPSISAQRCPHASFRHPLASSEANPRRSIEVRALVFSQIHDSDQPPPTVTGD
ncbi:Aspirochlorine biosynthesis protein N [Colletotrichum aenigma]|uniref:Aspirochlorine biosynthesis protein N n=1 Tax=Colletotrichum aenigma TaxID=1215731 RepID=UPI001872E85A|nr:Aspirochlorine biosynthesis protein N [Colletotrichum aenigma]KAF5512393.1 Aspirochlorine biosynthesis protein N [Colletotrichum aenigma]